MAPELSDTMARIRRTLGDAMFDEATRSGAAMTLHEVATCSNDQIQRALAAQGAGSDDH